MSLAKRFFKIHSHNAFFKALAGFGISLNRYYENRNHDIRSNGELTVLKKISKYHPLVIVDGGANVGKFSLLVSQLNPECRIYAFEPVENTFNALKENVKLSQNIIPINKGLFNDNSSKEINLFSSNTHSSLYDIKGLSYKPNEKTVVKLIRGDDFIIENKIDRVDFLKLDIEGAEFDAINGFSESLKNGKIKAVQFEYGYINITTKKLLIDFYNFFEANGYVVGKIFPKLVEFRKYAFKYEDFIGPNFIAVKKSEKDLINLLTQK